MNSILPVKVFNLSITQPEIIDRTHDNMRSWFHADGGVWEREYMPRTTMVFLVDDDELSDEECDQRAQEMAIAIS